MAATRGAVRLLQQTLGASAIRSGGLITANLPVLTAAAGRNVATSGASLFSQPQQKNTDEAGTSGQQSQQQQQAASTSGAKPSPEEVARQAFEALKSGYDTAKTKFEEAAGTSGSSSSSSSNSEGAEAGSSSSSAGAESSDDAKQRKSAFEALAKDVRATLLPEDDVTSATRMYTGPLAVAPEGEYTGPVDLVIRKQQKTGWEAAWESFQDKLSGIPILNRLASAKVPNVKETAAFKKGQELVEDLKEKYETSDHPVVHKVEEVKERLFTGSEQSRAMLEIRTRDPSFDMIRFTRMVKKDAPSVTKAFLKHDLETLKLHCGPELLERFSGIFKHFEAEGTYEDPTILHVGDVEVVEVREMDNDPFIIIQFHCQQLKCTRDKFGNVVEGSTDSIQRVYYFWGLQQEKMGVVTAEGELLAPRWVIKDMMWQSMLALV